MNLLYMHQLMQSFYILCHGRVFNTANYRQKRSITGGQFISIIFPFSNYANTIKQEKKLYRIYLRWLYTTETLATI